MPRTLFLVRHGPTEYNSGETKDPKTRGWIDIPLNADGVLEASKTAAKLAYENIEKIHTSDLNRAQQTANILRLAHPKDMPVEPDHGLRPWNLGDLSGRPIKEIEQDLNFYFQNKNIPVPNGESYQDFYNRWSGRLLGLMHEMNSTPGADRAIVTHSRNFSALKSVLTEGKEPPELHDTVKPAAMLRLSVGNGSFKLEEPE